MFQKILQIIIFTGVCQCALGAQGEMRGLPQYHNPVYPPVPENRARCSDSTYRAGPEAVRTLVIPNAQIFGGSHYDICRACLERAKLEKTQLEKQKNKKPKSQMSVMESVRAEKNERDLEKLEDTIQDWADMCPRLMLG